jgi:hypothetical protein
VVLGKTLVVGEAFKDKGSGLLRCLMVEFDEAGILEEPVNVCMIEPGEHDLRPFVLVKLGVNGHPLPTGPELDVVVFA